MKSRIDGRTDELRRKAEVHRTNADHNRAGFNNDKAIVHYEAALELDRQLGDLTNVSHDLYHLGMLYKGVSRLADAEHMFIDMVDVERRIGRTGYMAVAYENLGEIYARHGDQRASLEMFERCMAIIKATFTKKEYKSYVNLRRRNEYWRGWMQKHT